MVLYCKKCGYVFGEGYVPKLVSKGICPVCRDKLYKTQEGVGYFQSRIEKSMPTWEDVVRHKYLKNVNFDKETSSKRSNIEQKKQQDELRKLKSNSNITKPVKPVVKCLYCGSENVRKISGTERTISVLTLGFLSNKINKSFKCNDCGGTF